ncbi:MAG TPA: Arm DNA-binding domain-containing protein, partial [Paraburkholderia sp.]
MGRLTVRQIESAKPTGKRYELSDGDGLKLRVSPDGHKAWYVRFRVNGKQETARLARRYAPRTDDGHLSLEDARRDAATIIAKGREGTDFRSEFEIRKKEAKAAEERERAASLDVQTLFDEWMRDGIVHKDGGKELRRRFEKDVLPAIGTKPVRLVIEKDILAIVRRIAWRNAPRMALAIRDGIEQMFSWGERRLPWRRLIELNPAASITDETIVGRRYKEGEDTRPLDPKEIPEL